MPKSCPRNATPRDRVTAGIRGPAATISGQGDGPPLQSSGFAPQPMDQRYYSGVARGLVHRSGGDHNIRASSVRCRYRCVVGEGSCPEPIESFCKGRQVALPQASEISRRRGACADTGEAHVEGDIDCAASWGCRYSPNGTEASASASYRCDAPPTSCADRRTVARTLSGIRGPYQRCAGGVSVNTR